jgi:hypothetical protein
VPRKTIPPPAVELSLAQISPEAFVVENIAAIVPLAAKTVEEEKETF